MAFACPPGSEGAFRARLSQPANNSPATAKLETPTLVQIVDILDVSISRQAQIERLLGDQGRRHAPDVGDDGTGYTENSSEGDSNPKQRAKALWRLAVQDSSGTTAFMIYTHPPTAEPRLGAICEIAAGAELHRGVLVVSPSTVREIVQGQSITREQWQWRLTQET